MSPIAATSDAALMMSIAGIVVSRCVSRDPRTNCATLGVEARDLGLEEVDLPQGAVDGLALLLGQIARGQAPATGRAEQVAHRRAGEPTPRQGRTAPRFAPGGWRTNAPP